MSAHIPNSLKYWINSFPNQHCSVVCTDDILKRISLISIFVQQVSNLSELYDGFCIEALVRMIFAVQSFPRVSPDALGAVG